MDTDSRQEAIRQFADACARDDRVVAAFLGGSFAKGTEDSYSDLDLYVIAPEEAYDSLFAEREGLLRQLGHLVVVEDRNTFGFDMVLFVFADGVRGELAFGRQSGFLHLHGGPFRTLVDKAGALENVTFPYYRVPEEEQRANVRALIWGFWRDGFWFRKALGRGHLWEAHAWLEKLRYASVKLACLDRGCEPGTEGYHEAERILPAPMLDQLRATWCAPEDEALREAVHRVVRFYREVAPRVAERHDVPYPHDLEAVVLRLLDEMQHDPTP
jgi:predicted nucleotidyltransferase